MKKKPNENLLCGIITKEQQIKARKKRSADVLMPKGGYYITQKDRPRNKNWRTWKN